MLWQRKASLHSFHLLTSNNAVAPKSFIVLILFCSHPTVLWHHKASLYWFYFFLYNNAVAPQSSIVLILFLSIQQCCDTTKLHCICSYPTMFWHHKDSLSSFYFFSYNSAVVPQSVIVLISFITIQQCCGTTKLHCPHSFLPIQQCCDTTKLNCTHLFIIIQQCCGATKIHCLKSFSSHPTMLWY